MDNKCGKKQYSSQKEANKSKKKQMKKNPSQQLTTYRCDDCKGFHLTKHLYRIGK